MIKAVVIFLIAFLFIIALNHFFLLTLIFRLKSNLPPYEVDVVLSN